MKRLPQDLDFRGTLLRACEAAHPSTFVDRTSHDLLSPANRLKLRHSATMNEHLARTVTAQRNEAGFHSRSIHRSSHIGLRLQFGRVRSG